MSCYNATVLNAPADQVWATIRSFHDLSWSANVVTDVKVVGDAGATEVGAKRVLNDAFHETLHSLDDEAMVIRYSIDDGPGPLSGGQVTGYFGEVRVLPVTVGGDGQTVVVWTSSWDTEAGGVADFCDPIYKALLGDMKAHFG